MNEPGITRIKLVDGEPYRIEADGSLTPIADETDWARVDALTDEEIEAAVASDPDAAPIADEAWFERARERRRLKVRLWVELDRDIAKHFDTEKRGFSDRINAALRASVQAEPKKQRARRIS